MRSKPPRQRVVHLDLHREIRYITARAQAGDARLVSVGKLALFSTATGDAWLLDLADQCALCLCEGGKAQVFKILETPQTLAIEWPGKFTIRGAEFIVHDKSGGATIKSGYPISEIAAAMGNAR